MLEPGAEAPTVSATTQFVESEGLLFDLLADPDSEIAAAFGVDTSGGRTERRIFIVSEGAVIRRCDPPADYPAGHAEAVLRDARNEFVQGG